MWGDDNFLYVISTKDKLWGSKALLDDDTLLRMSSMFGCSFQLQGEI